MIEQTLAMPIANRITGIDSTMSAVREMSVSNTPPRKPAVMPRVTPTTVASPVAPRATMSEVRAPYRVRMNMSRPTWSPPNQNVPLGPLGRPRSGVTIESKSWFGP